jgi:hypothetical protein
MLKLSPGYLLVCSLAMQSSCAFKKDKYNTQEPNIKIVHQIIRAQFCTLARIKGIDKRVFLGETDTSSWSYSLTHEFTGRERRNSTIKYIRKYLTKKQLPIENINEASIFKSAFISLQYTTKLDICNEYHKVIIYAKNDTIHQKSSLLAIAQPVIINDSLRLYYYEFGKYPSVSAGYSVLNFTKQRQAEPVYEESLWISCGSGD